MVTNQAQRYEHVKKYSFVLFFGCILVFALACGCSGRQSTAVAKFSYAPSSTVQGINNIRLEALKQTSRGVGAQAGLAWKSQQINNILAKYKSQLNQIFNFNHLILNNNVLPPVLAENANDLNLSDARTIRVSDHYYKIIAQPRFITSPPVWHDYLSMAYKSPTKPNSTLLPRNGNEVEVWNRYIKIGWEEGVKQADQIFGANLNRLTRDFQGMVLYKKLLGLNMISKPFVATANLGITGDEKNLRINDRVLRITAIPEFKQSESWNPVIVENH